MTTLPINESQTCKRNIFSVIRTILLNIIMTAYTHIVCHVGRHIFIVTQSKNDNFHSIILTLLDNRMKGKKQKQSKKVRVQLQYAKPFSFIKLLQI